MKKTVRFLTRWRKTQVPADHEVYPRDGGGNLDEEETQDGKKEANKKEEEEKEEEEDWDTYSLTDTSSPFSTMSSRASSPTSSLCDEQTTTLFSKSPDGLRAGKKKTDKESRRNRSTDNTSAHSSVDFVRLMGLGLSHPIRPIDLIAIYGRGALAET